MPGPVQYLAELTSHQTGLLAPLVLLGLPLFWRGGGPPERASILTLAGLAILDLLVWQYGSGMALLHFFADALALSWILPVALRANRFYPAVITSALLVAVLAQLFHLTGLASDAGSVAFVANILHALAVLALLGGSLTHRRIVATSNNRPAWRNRSSHG